MMISIDDVIDEDDDDKDGKDVDSDDCNDMMVLIMMAAKTLWFS